jgi:hypothetical protein
MPMASRLAERCLYFSRIQDEPLVKSPAWLAECLHFSAIFPSVTLAIEPL